MSTPYPINLQRKQKHTAKPGITSIVFLNDTKSFISVLYNFSLESCTNVNVIYKTEVSPFLYERLPKVFIIPIYSTI